MTYKRRIQVAGIVAVVLVSILVPMLTYLDSVSEYQRTVANIEITDIDISRIPDGTYNGEYNVGFINARVEVTVKAGAIMTIYLLEHKNGKGAHAEKITGDIIREQKVDVDTISGATNSSKVILKAVENALKSSGSAMRSYKKWRAVIEGVTMDGATRLALRESKPPKQMVWVKTLRKNAEITGVNESWM